MAIKIKTTKITRILSVIPERRRDKVCIGMGYFFLQELNIEQQDFLQPKWSSDLDRALDEE